MSTRDIRKAVLNRVGQAGHRDTRYGNKFLPQELGHELGCSTQDVWEALWSLASDGLIYLVPDPRYQGWEYWRWWPSAVGARALEGGPWEPGDPEGYLLRLRQQVPGLDPLALRYVEESLGAFNARCYLATSVMLGVASEAAFDGLAAAFLASLGGDAAERARRSIGNARQSYSSRWEEFRRRLEPMRDQLPGDLRDRLLLDAVSDLLRITRNDAGHPSGRLVDEDTARTHLTIAATYLGRMTALRNYFAVRARPAAAGTEAAPTTGR